jgi:hypothetical protein
MSTQTASHGCEAGLTLSISPIVKTTTSTPTSPGAASPSALRGLPLILDQLKVPSIEPPTRPKSTPFSWQETLNCDYPMRTPNGSDQSQTILKSNDELQQGDNVPASRLTFSRLPTEIHELILDHLFGVRASTANTTSSSRGWSTALRHSRRRQLSDVALISRSYRELVQGRLFKHSGFAIPQIFFARTNTKQSRFKVLDLQLTRQSSSSLIVPIYKSTPGILKFGVQCGSGELGLRMLMSSSLQQRLSGLHLFV